MGKSVVPQTVTASSGGFSAAASATVASDYTVDLRFFGPTPAPEAAAAFTKPQARIRAAVIGDVADVNIPVSTNNAGIALSQCGVSGGVVLNEIVDDVVILRDSDSNRRTRKNSRERRPVFRSPRNGSNCVPTASQCNSFSIIGVMRFDADDIALLTSTNRLNA
jgi:hypothetical protein